jgi:hypothetical protein
MASPVQDLRNVNSPVSPAAEEPTISAQQPSKVLRVLSIVLAIIIVVVVKAAVRGALR